MLRSLAKRAALALEAFAKSSQQPPVTPAPTPEPPHPAMTLTLAELCNTFLTLAKRIDDATLATTTVCSTSRETLASAVRIMSAPFGPAADAAPAPPTFVEAIRRFERSAAAVEYHAEQLAFVLSLLTVDPDNLAS